MQGRSHLAGWIAAAAVLALLAFAPIMHISAQTFGTGWTAQYYNNTNLEGAPVFTEALSSGLNFNWGAGSPNAAVNAENWSARFSSVQLFNAGTYEFVVSSDDGVRVFIDGVLVLDRFIGRPLTTDRFQQTLTAGSHSLVVEFVEFIDTAALQFQWFQISGGTQLTPGVPGTELTPGVVPTAVYTGPTATVTGVQGLALRTGPYLGASFITTLPSGVGYPVLARNRDEGIYNWYKLRVGEREGWASGRFLTISVDLNTLPVQGSIFDDIADTSDIGARAYPRAVMNLRQRPSLRTPQIGSVPWGAECVLLGRTVQAGTNRWLYVRCGDLPLGWVDARWVTVRGEVFQVPIR